MTKSNQVFGRLIGGAWVSVPELLTLTGSSLPTLRVVLSIGKKKRGLVLERKRENKITYYRVIGPGDLPTAEPAPISSDYVIPPTTDDNLGVPDFLIRAEKIT